MNLESSLTNGTRCWWGMQKAKRPPVAGRQCYGAVLGKPSIGMWFRYASGSRRAWTTAVSSAGDGEAARLVRLMVEHAGSFSSSKKRDRGLAAALDW